MNAGSTENKTLDGKVDRTLRVELKHGEDGLHRAEVWRGDQLFWSGISDATLEWTLQHHLREMRLSRLLREIEEVHKAPASMASMPSTLVAYDRTRTLLREWLDEL